MPSMRQPSAAATPTLSAWVSANAGSGKTHVLARRVIRLLLRGARPSAILCLTYTKAAATEMQNRLIGRLGEWAMLDDSTLTAQLAAMGVGPAADLAAAGAPLPVEDGDLFRGVVQSLVYAAVFTALGFRHLTNYIARSLLETGGFRTQLLAPRQ